MQPILYCRHRGIALLLVLFLIFAAGAPHAGHAWSGGPATGPSAHYTSDNAGAGGGTGFGSPASGGSGGPAAGGGPGTDRAGVHGIGIESDTYTVTLITGDRVIVSEDGSGQSAVAIVGRQGASDPDAYETLRIGSDTYVYPEDVFHLLGTTLDHELFNVTALVRHGYHDEALDSIPVIVMGARSLQSPGADTAGAFVQGLSSLNMETTYEYSSISAAAARIPKEKAGSGAWGRVLTASASGGADLLNAEYGIEKIWLDTPVEAFLEDSVPHIGAPEAWDLGYDGTGIRVAVLDTGIDKNHPDLQGRIVAERDFTNDNSTGDEHGHGTHVASTLAGSGAASGGLRKGVAPGAELINAKVLASSGTGSSSWVMAAMEWAAGPAGADVINMSLGNPQASDGTDPMSTLLNSLTEEYGVLFVVAAGNAGAFQSVGVPAVADSALAVANFTKEDRLAPLSSRGPRYLDWAVKPEIAAPGQLIAAARAEGTALGPIVDEHYTRISGTSMATPHVAGAAAIMLQKYGSLEAGQLKAALAGTARTIDGYTVYEQGAGRLDVDRAISQGVYTTEAALSFGYFPLPYDQHDPVTKTFGYRNSRDEAVTLDLAVEVRNRDGDPVSGLLTLKDDTITVGAGETVETSVTLSPAAGETSLYSAYITASSADGDVELVVPVGFYLEPDRFDLTVELTRPDGQPMTGTLGLGVFQVAGDLSGSDKVVARQLTFTDGKASIRLDPGVYHVGGFLPWGSSWNYVSYPEISLYDGDESIAIDMRDRVPIGASVDTHQVHRDIWTTVGSWRVAVEGETFLFSNTAHLQQHLDAYAVPTGPVTRGEFHFWSRWRLVNYHLDGTGGAGIPAYDDDPVAFDLFFNEKGSIPEVMDYRITDEDFEELITVESRFHHNEDPVRAQETRHLVHPSFGSPATGVYFVEAPVVRTDYLSPGIMWSTRLFYDSSPGPGSGTIVTPGRGWQPGDEITYPSFKQPVRPTLIEADVIDADGTARVNDQPGRRRRPARMGNRFTAHIANMSDSTRYHSSNSSEFSDVKTEMRLYRDGEFMGAADSPMILANLAPEPAEYRLEVDVDLSPRAEAPWAKLSTQTYTAWTFQSAFVDGEELIPFLLADYDINLSLLNTAPRPGSGGRADELGLHLHYPAWHDGEAEITDVDFWISGDDGSTWTAVDNIEHIEGGYYTVQMAGIEFDADAEYVSIKLEAWTDRGESIQQEIIRAYRIQDTPGPELTVAEPEDGTYTNADFITVAGTAVDPEGGGVTVTVNGEEAAIGADGSFTFTELLPEEDGEHVITVTAVNDGGAETVETRTVYVDRTDPVIDEGSIRPADNVELAPGETTIIGFTGEPGLTAGYTVLAAGAGNARFTAAVPGTPIEEKSEGVYEAVYTAPADTQFENAAVEIHAADAAGNTITVEAPGRITVRPSYTAPELTITAPADGYLTNSQVVLVTGVASDEQGIDTVTIDGRAVAVAADGTFSGRALLDEGENIIEVTATNVVGLETTETVTVIADWTDPVLANIRPAEDVVLEWGEQLEISFTSESGLTAAYQLMLNGITAGAGSSAGDESNGTDAGEGILVRGAPFEEDAGEPGTYRAVYTAPEASFSGAVIQINAMDPAGNKVHVIAPGRVTVVPAAEPVGPPELIITEPEDGLLTNRGAVRISGVATDGQPGQSVEEVTVNGRRVAVEDDGSFTTRIALAEGANTITVQATNTAGEAATETVTVTADWTPPELTNMEPAEDVTLTAGQSYTVRFTAEKGLEAAFQVIIGGQRGEWYGKDIPVRGVAMVEVEDGVYEGTYTAPAGTAFSKGIVQFNAADKAGNVTMVTAPGSITVVNVP